MDCGTLFTMPILLGRFELLERAGRGAMGEVWRARHLDADIPVAVKLLNNRGVRNPLAQEAFINEIRVIAGLRHAAVISIIDQGIVPPNGVLPASRYLAMDVRGICTNVSLTAERLEMA